MKTAQQGLSNISDMLIRMKELATQAKNGIYTTKDLQTINKEFHQISRSINEIANKTNFNRIPLLNTSSTSTINAMVMQSTNSIVDLSRASSITVWYASPYYDILDGVPEPSVVTIPMADLIQPGGYQHIGLMTKFIFYVDLASNTFTSKSFYEPGNGYLPFNSVTGIRVNGLTDYEVSDTFASVLYDYTPGQFAEASQEMIEKFPDLAGVNFTAENALGPDTSLLGMVFYEPSTAHDTFITVQFEANDLLSTEEPVEPSLGNNEGIRIHKSSEYNSVYTLKTSNVTLEALGLENVNAFDSDSIRKIDEALETVTKEQIKFGTYENILNVKTNSLNTSNVQTERANSRISDVDMVKESSELSKQQIAFQKNTTLLQKAEELHGTVIQLLQY